MMETQALIQEIQKKHQITLKPDDPVFVAVTLNDMLLSHYLEKFQAMLEEQNKLVVSQGIERLNQASAIGSEMINRTLEALSQTIVDSKSRVTNHIVDLFDVKTQQQAQALQKRNSVLHWVIYIIVACSFFVLGTMFKEFFS